MVNGHVDGKPYLDETSDALQERAAEFYCLRAGCFLSDLDGWMADWRVGAAHTDIPCLCIFLDDDDDEWKRAEKYISFIHVSCFLALMKVTLT